MRCAGSSIPCPIFYRNISNKEGANFAGVSSLAIRSKSALFILLSYLRKLVTLVPNIGAIASFRSSSYVDGSYRKAESKGSRLHIISGPGITNTKRTIITRSQESFLICLSSIQIVREFPGGIRGIKTLSSNPTRMEPSSEAGSPIKTYQDYNQITSKIINKVLVKQQVSISQTELDRLKNLPGVKFDLLLSDQTYPSFVSLVGKPKSKLRKSGVYIFIHKKSGSKYVGSSNSLSKRLDSYFNDRHNRQRKSQGLLIPLIDKEGMSAFSLEIFIIPLEFPKDSYMFLEQFFLLHADFNLNTLK